MIPIDDNKAYEVLNDGDNIQIIHECGNKVLIGFIDPASGDDVLSWVDCKYIFIEQKADECIAPKVNRVHIRLAYSRELGIIGDTPKQETRRWSLPRPLQSRYLRAALLLVLALLVLML